MKKIILLLILILTSGTAFALPPTPPGTLLPSTCANGQVTAFNSTTGKWDTCADNAGGATMATDTLWDAAGDLAVGTGANTGGRLAVGTAYQLLHSNGTTPAWTSTLGVTGTRLTKGWFTDLEITNLPTINGGTLAASLGTATWGAGAAITWTFNASGGTDSTLTFGDNTLAYSGAFSAASMTVSPSATPTMTFSDSDNAAGTAAIYGNSSGGANDIIMTIGVEAGGSENVAFIEIDGVTETIDLLKPVVTSSTVTTGGNIELGHASDTTIARSGAGAITVEGNQVILAGVATGGVILGDASPDAAGEFGFDTDTFKFYSGTGAGSLKLFEAAANGSDYSSITGAADAGTYPSFTFGGSQGSEDLTLAVTAANTWTISSSTGVTDIKLQGAAAANAMNLATTGTILGAVKVIDMGTGATYTLAAANAYGSMLLMTDSDSVTTVALPDYQAAADVDHVKIGATVCVMNLQAQATIVDPAADDKIRTSNGTLNGAGVSVTGPATVGAFSCFMLTDAATDVGHWTQLGMNGAWPVTP